MTDTPGWPATLRGITESVVATPGPDGRWNVAALGLHAPGHRKETAGDGDAATADGPVTAVTWGDTRTRRNFAREGRGVVQFVSDPRTFVDAALSVVERDDPVVGSADAWVRVGVERVAAGEDGGTRWRRWRLDPREAGVRRECVPTINRGFDAVIEATIAASRLDVSAYDTGALLARLERLEGIVEACGGPAEREAFARVDAHTGWRDRS